MINSIENSKEGIIEKCKIIPAFYSQPTVKVPWPKWKEDPPDWREENAQIEKNTSEYLWAWDEKEEVPDIL